MRALKKALFFEQKQYFRNPIVITMIVMRGVSSDKVGITTTGEK
jgi:hypothetical protein